MNVGFNHKPDSSLLVPVLSLFKYEKGNMAQSLIYKLKYSGRKDIGIYLGKMLGELIKKDGHQIDFILPVPLTPIKHMKREFNQAEIIAHGISEVLGCPTKTNVIKRKSAKRSQTRLGNWERWINTEGSFYLNPSKEIHTNSSVLVVDDVLTTGATLANCVKPLVGTFNNIYACTLASV